MSMLDISSITLYKCFKKPNIHRIKVSKVMRKVLKMNQYNTVFSGYYHYRSYVKNECET